MSKLYINNREIQDVEIDTSWLPDLSIESASYVDDGTDVEVGDLDSIDQTELHWYWTQNR